MSSSKLVTVSEETHDFFHNPIKNKEIALLKNTSYRKSDLIQITKTDFDLAGRHRSKGNFVTFSANGKLSVRDKNKVASTLKFYQELSSSSAKNVVSKSKESLLTYLEQRRDEKLYGEKVYIDDVKYIYSDRKSTERLASYLILSGDIETIWYHKKDDVSFPISREDMDTAYSKISQHQAKIHSEFSIMMDMLLKNNQIADYENWNPEKVVANYVRSNR